MSRRVVRGAVAITVAAAIATASIATAEVSQKKGVRVSVAGSMNPTKLPRQGSAPIEVSVSGRISAVDRAAIPKLTAIEIAINRYGKLDTRGVPLCRLGHISPSTTQQALAACGSSLIGEGSFSADVRIPEQSPFPSQGKVLAFNGKLRGKPAILAHIYGTKPVPTSYVLPFSISSTKGSFGTVLAASLPYVTGEWGYVTGISLKLQPRVLSASCPAPRGTNAGVFSLARTSFRFGSLSLSSTLIRTCTVAGR